MGGLRTRKHPLIQWCLCVEKETAHLLFQKAREVLPFSVLPWPQRDVSCCGPGGCRVLTRNYPKGSWTARTQATNSSIHAGVRTPASLIKKLTGLWQSQDAASVHSCIRKNPFFHAENKAHPRRERIPVNGENTNSQDALLMHKDKLCFAFLVSYIFLFNCSFFRSEIPFINSESPWQWLAKIYEGCVRVDFLIW